MDLGFAYRCPRYTRWNNTGHAFLAKWFSFNRRDEGMPLELFKGERTFMLTARPDGLAEFSMREGYGADGVPI